jgi:filamentous hemagglutinin family protein
MASRSPSSIRFAPRALCAGAALSVAGCVFAQPAGLTPLHGSAIALQAGSVTTITTRNGAGTRHSALDWRSFGVPRGQTVWFSQPDALSTSINRVLGGSPSNILGTLGSNGRVVLVNPAGIAVGGGAVVDTAGFTASTLAMSRPDAIAGRLRFGAADRSKFGRDDGGDDRAGRVRVEGRVLARNGDVVLIGGDVDTGSAALLEASAGDVLVAAGHTVELTGRGLEGIRLEVRAPEGRAVNLGTLRGDSVAIFARQLRHSGLIQAVSVTSTGGRVVLQAREEAEVRGRIEAGHAARGGSVLLTAGEVKLERSARIDVSHAAGGGEILVGGGLDGRDTRLPNAQQVDVASGAVLRADATRSGSGGTVAVWSREETRFEGLIQARGAGGGTGGPVQVLSAGRTRFKGRVDVDGDGSGTAAVPRPVPGGGNAGPGNPGPGNSGTDDSGPGNAGNPGRPGPSRAPLPRVPLAGQPVEVQSGVAQPAADTAEFIAASSRLLAPGQGGLARAFEAAGNGDPEGRLNAAGSGRRGEPEVVVTPTQCRPGS